MGAVSVLGAATALLAAAPGASQVAVGAEGDGVVQPGDRTAPGRCTAGPVVDGVAFTAAHCTVDSIDGRRLDQLGAFPDPQAGTPGLDVQWFATDAETSAAISNSAGDVEVAGVLRPWPGMAVSKTGWVSGTTSGVIYDGPDALLAGSSVQGMQVCHGDSGAVVYAEVGPTRDVYVVGMVTNGNGGTNRVTGEEEPNGTCSEFPPIDGSGEPDYWATIRRVDALCDAAGLTGCVAQAGRLFGDITTVVGDVDHATVNAWAFDATDPRQPVVMRVVVDGGGASDVVVSRRRVRTVLDYSIVPDAAVAASVEIALGPGEHEVCLTALNQGAGDDLELGCRRVRVGERYVGLADGGGAGTPSDRWWSTLEPTDTIEM